MDNVTRDVVGSPTLDSPARLVPRGLRASTAERLSSGCGVEGGSCGGSWVRTNATN